MVSASSNNNKHYLPFSQKQKQNQVANEPEEEISILLDPQNFILNTRCSHALNLQIERKSGRPRLSSKMLVFAPRSRAPRPRGPQPRKRRQSDRLKLLSTLITIESHAPFDEAPESDTTRRAEQRAPTTQWPADAPTPSEWAGAGPVKLRSNLTELYICFDQSGKLEAKVSRPNE